MSTSDGKCIIIGSIFGILLSLTIIAGFIGITVFEIQTVKHNNPNKVHLDAYNTNAYAFTMTKSVLNCIFGFIVASVFCCTGIGSLCSKDTSKKSGYITFVATLIVASVCILITMAIDIWGLVNYYNFQDKLLDDFQQVMYAEMIIFFTAIASLGFAVIVGCCSCCCFAYVEEKKYSTNFGIV
jgi:hypothetical protein